MYNHDVTGVDFDSPEFDIAVSAACYEAFRETLAAGLPVFYIDDAGLDVMEQADGRRFEVEWMPGAPAGENYTVIRELPAAA